MTRPLLVARLMAGSLAVTAPRRGQRDWQAEYPFGDDGQLGEALASLAEPVRQQGLPRRVLVLVEPPVLQRRLLTDVPPIGAAELNRLVTRATPRYFRQNGHTLVSAARWDDQTDLPRRVVRAVAFDLSTAEAIVAGVARAGLSLSDIVPAAEEASLSLLPPAELRRRRRATLLGLGRLATLVMLLWIGVGVFLAVRLQVESRRIHAELTRLSEPRQSLAAARKAMNSASDMVSALDQAESQRNEIAARLTALVEALPLSSYLTTVTLERDGTGSATGQSQDLALLAGSLKESTGIGSSRLEGAMTRDSLTGDTWQRFNLVLGAPDSR